MGLNDRFDIVRNHILLIEPLASVNKYYYLVLRFKKQMDMQVLINADTNNTVVFEKVKMLKKLCFITAIQIMRI